MNNAQLLRVFFDAPATVTATSGVSGNRRGVRSIAQVWHSHAPRFLFWEHRRRPQLRVTLGREREILLYWMTSPGHQHGILRMKTSRLQPLALDDHMTGLICRQASGPGSANR